jgi:ribosomal protein S18 acetylase RimI-like enzyme
VVKLAFEYLSWAIIRLENEYGVEWPPLTQSDVREGLDEYRSEGVVLIAERAGEPLGMGAVRQLDEQVAEVKRMYVREEARGLHIGSMLLDLLMREAENLGARIVRLDTIRFMTDAQRLYRARGFVERPPYEGTEIPGPLQHHWLFFERSLAGALPDS